MDIETGNEQELLERAIQAVERETGIQLRVLQREHRNDRRRVDAVLELVPGQQTFMVEVKRWAQHANLGALINQIQQLPQTGILVADYVNPKMADKLREHDVNFIDCAGNAYINKTPVYIYVTGRQGGLQAQGTVIKGGTAQRAFEPTGLKVVYAFLCDPELANAPYREIAEKAGVALGTVGWVINSLKAAGLLMDKGKRQGRRLANYRKLLDRWVETWPEKLKPKQLLGEFVADDPYWWKAIHARDFGGYWGGEIAAAIYTNYLKPKVATLYLPERVRNQLLREARLRKAEEGTGTVLLYRPFWPEKYAQFYIDETHGVVHPILIYADLVATGDHRNLEAARRLYDDHIARYNGED